MDEQTKGAGVEGGDGAKGQAAGPKGKDKETGENTATSDEAKKLEKLMNPSSPGDTGTTPGSNAPIG